MKHDEWRDRMEGLQGVLRRIPDNPEEIGQADVVFIRYTFAYLNYQERFYIWDNKHGLVVACINPRPDKMILRYRTDMKYSPVLANFSYPVETVNVPTSSGNLGIHYDAIESALRPSCNRVDRKWEFRYIDPATTYTFVVTVKSSNIGIQLEQRVQFPSEPSGREVGSMHTRLERMMNYFGGSPYVGMVKAEQVASDYKSMQSRIRQQERGVRAYTAASGVYGITTDRHNPFFIQDDHTGQEHDDEPVTDQLQVAPGSTWGIREEFYTEPPQPDVRTETTEASDSSVLNAMNEIMGESAREDMQRYVDAAAAMATQSRERRAYDQTESQPQRDGATQESNG